MAETERRNLVKYPFLSRGSGTSGLGGFELNFTPDWTQRKGSNYRLTANLKTLESIGLPEETLGTVSNAVHRWIQNVLNKNIPKVVHSVLYTRKSEMEGLTGARAYVATYETQGATQGKLRYDFRIAVKVPPRAAPYAGVQEYGRVPKGRAGAGYYLVPLSSAYPSNIDWTEAKLRSELSQKGTFWIPKGRNYLRDSFNRPMKMVLRMKEDFSKKYSYGKLRSARGLSKARKELADKMAKERSAKGLRGPVPYAEEMAQHATTLFVAYPQDITGIPGKSLMARSSKKARFAYNSAALKRLGIGGKKTRGFGGEPSRWWSRSLALSEPQLAKYLTNEKMRAAIRSSLARMWAQKTGITFRGRRVNTTNRDIEETETMRNFTS